MFCGSNHLSDCVRVLRRDGSRPMLLGYGRVGSFFPPSEREGDCSLPFLRGARVIEVILPGKSIDLRDHFTTGIPPVEEAENDETLPQTPNASPSGLLRTWVAHSSQSQPVALVEFDLGC